MSKHPESLSHLLRADSPEPFRLPLRPRSLVASLGVHAVVVTLLFSVSSSVPSPFVESPKFRPEDHQIVYYNFKKSLPKVTSDRKVLEAPDRGAQIAKQTVVVKRPQPKSQQQVILTPAPKLQLQQDQFRQDMIARLRTALPPLPAPPKPAPKPEVKQGVVAPVPVAAVEPPKELNKAPENNQDLVRAPKPVKAFVPPPPSPRTPRLPTQTAILDAPDPLVAAPPTQSALPPGAGFPTLSSGAVPLPNAPPAPVARDGNARQEIAVVNLRPSDKAGNELPNGDRSGEFSKAPTVGAPSASGDGKGVVIPGIDVHEEPAKKPKPPDVAPPMRTVIYTDLMRNIPLSTLSAPLRPGVRSLPRNIEPRFQQRVAYTMVVPIENLPMYMGDWILWFAERQPDPAISVVVRAPVPYRKQEPIDPNPPAARTSLRAQIAGVLEKDGRLHDLQVLTVASPEVAQAMIKDLVSWEFKPATRNAAPVAVDVVFEIPFNLPTPRTGN